MINFTFARTVKRSILHTLQHPTYSRCCTFLPDSKGRKETAIYLKKYYLRKFCKTEHTLAARIMLFGD